MNRIYEAATMALVHAESTLPGGVTAAWDIKNLLSNAKTWVQTVGGLLLMLLGVAGLIWGGVLLVKKLMGNQQGGQGTAGVRSCCSSLSAARWAPAAGR
ncbi:hypothetical protein AHiyo8_02280 [Arthrobacter sp. Hiyo8]|nr:hypothetical protein AHiyo8_02280 [Arthrobacter sp. Hiyo8]